MKKLLCIAILLASMASQAQVGAKQLGAVDTVFEMTKQEFQVALNDLGEASNYIQGKWMAAHIDMIEQDIQSIERDLYSINDLEDTDQSEVDELEQRITNLQELISELGTY